MPWTPDDGREAHPQGGNAEPERALGQGRQ
jgi:hypothetical protein